MFAVDSEIQNGYSRQRGRFFLFLVFLFSIVRLVSAYFSIILIRLQLKVQMRSQQQQLKQLLTQKSTHIFPTLHQILQTYKSYQQFEDKILGKIDATESKTQNFEDQGKQLREKYKLAFQGLDQELDKAIKKITLKDRSKMRERQKSLQPINELKNETKLNRPETSGRSFQKRIISPKIIRGKIQNVQDSPNKRQTQQEPNKTAKKTSGQQLISTDNKPSESKQLTLVSKTKGHHLQIYVCFICARANKQSSMWQKELPYLTHMKEKHALDLQFQKLVATQQQLTCSHAYFKGRLVNLLKNYQNDLLKRIFYLLSKQKYEQLFFCGCMLIGQVSIMATQQQFYQHYQFHQSNAKRIRRLTQQDLENSSHRVVVQGNLCTLQPNHKFKYEDVPTNFSKVIHHVRCCYFKQFKQYNESKMLTLDRMNLLELMSCHKKVRDQLTSKYIFHAYPYCSPCNLYFQSPNLHYGHDRSHHKGCDMIWEDCEINLDNILKFRSKTKEYQTVQLPNVVGLDQQEQNTLKAQLCLMKTEKGAYLQDASFICGQCLSVFKCTSRVQYIKYMLHIYLQHRQIHPLNSHHFLFLQQNASVPAFDNAIVGDLEAD